MAIKLSQKLETALSHAASKLKHFSGAEDSDTEVQRDEIVLSNEQRRQFIAEAAYARAEQRGFTGGSPEQDWLEAEMEIDRYIMEATPVLRPADGADPDEQG